MTPGACKKAILISGLLLFSVFFHAQTVPVPLTTEELDSRVKLHYTELDLNKIKLVAPYKLEQLNFQYTSSFQIINQKGNAIKYDAKKFDVYAYERFRKEDQRVTFTLTRDGDAVELLSRKELQAIYKKIQDKYQSAK